MAQAARESNQVTSALGSYNGSPVTLKVEHVTGYLKVKVKPATLSAPTYSPTLDKRDDNDVHTTMGTYNGLPKALLTQHASGYIRAIIN